MLLQNITETKVGVQLVLIKHIHANRIAHAHWLSLGQHNL